MNTNTRVTKFSKSITLGEHKALQGIQPGELYVPTFIKDDDTFVAMEDYWLFQLWNDIIKKG